MSNLLKIKVMIEVPCDDCKGSGEVDLLVGDGSTGFCSGCDGEGSFQQKISMLQLQNLIGGGDL